jgi:hypothetical protein
VERIGWNQDLIVAWRTAISGRSGWMVIDVGSRTITGPFSDQELVEEARERPELRAIKIYSVKEAWDRL